MKNIISKLKEHSLSFIFLNIYLFVLIFLPKTYSTILGIPIRLTLAFVLLGIIFYEYKKGKIKLNNYKSKSTYLFLIIFTLAIIPSIVVSKNIITSIYTYFKFLVAVILFIVLCKVKFDNKEYNILLKNLIISLIIISLIGLIQYVFDIDLMVKNSGINYYPGAKGRLGVTFFNSIYYGIFINLINGFVIYSINKSNDKKKNIILIILFGLLYANLIFTFTRSAVLIYFGLLVILICLLTKFKFKLKYLIMLFLIVIISFSIQGASSLIEKSVIDGYKMVTKIATFLPSTNTNEEEEYVDYDENSEFTDYSLQHREAFARIAKTIATDNLYTGVGFGSYLDYMESEDFDLKYPEYTLSKTHPHSSLVLIFAETGIFGLIGLILMFTLFTLKSLSLFIHTYKNGGNVYQVSVVSLAMVIGFILINVMSENAVYDSQINYIFMTLYGLCLGYCYNNLKNNKILFISSTGGHLDELLQLKDMFKKYNYYIVTEKTKSNLNLKNKYPKKVSYLVYGTSKNMLVYPFKILYNSIKSLFIYIKFRPGFIITTGAHTAGPMCCIGKILGSKIIYIETFANSKTKSTTGKIVYKFADLFIVQWESMLEVYPKAKYGGWIY